RREKNVSLLEQLKQNWQTLIYPRNSEQEFWDGYTGQKVCIFDDWNQLVDSTANPSMELFELIRASNVFPYPLHMAHLEDKSSVNFSSDVIICSSNNQLPRVESLNFPKALIRRFTKFVKVERKSATSAFDFSSYVITPYNEAGEMSDSISVEKFVDNVVNEYMHNKSFVTSINNFVAGSLLDFNPEDLVNGKPLESAPQSNVDTMSDISQFMINSVENNNTTELTLCPEKLLSLQCEGGLWNKEQKPDPDATTIATSTTWRAMYDKENSEFIVDAVQNLKDGYVIHNVRNKMSAFVNQYSWINCNTTYILGALGLIAAGLYLYRTIYPPSTSSAESVDKLDTIVRARKNAR
ncbi:RNA helicase domain-containing protein, partial [Flavobacterium poyangense]|uniref:RNA helicase domain-containing protein n=1 Tax=Flavobacterium poyangense TaxID=2204302 RepID=UPI00141E99B0